MNRDRLILLACARRGADSAIRHGIGVAEAHERADLSLKFGQQIREELAGATLEERKAAAALMAPWVGETVAKWLAEEQTEEAVFRGLA